MIFETSQLASLSAALLSAIAAIAAAVAAWRAPIGAARIAEHLRRQGDSDAESRRFRLNVFTEIMQGRAEIWQEETVRSFNSIDIAFSKSNPVREAWSELYQSLTTKPFVSHVVDERIRKLLREMAYDLGISNSLRLDDFSRVYFPTALQEDRESKALQRRAMIRQYGESSTSVDSNDESTSNLWPPKPE